MEAKDIEPPVIHKELKVKEFWKRGRTRRKVIVSSGPLPEESDLPSVEPPPGEETRVEPEMPRSPTYPTTKPPREDVPMGGVPTGDRD